MSSMENLARMEFGACRAEGVLRRIADEKDEPLRLRAQAVELTTYLLHLAALSGWDTEDLLFQAIDKFSADSGSDSWSPELKLARQMREERLNTPYWTGLDA